MACLVSGLDLEVQGACDLGVTESPPLLPAHRCAVPLAVRECGVAGVEDGVACGEGGGVIGGRSYWWKELLVGGVIGGRNY